MLAGLWAREEYRAASAAETTLAAIKRSKQNLGARCAAIAAWGGGVVMAYAHLAGGGTRREGREALTGAETCAERSPFQNIAEHPRTFLNSSITFLNGGSPNPSSVWSVSGVP